MKSDKMIVDLETKIKTHKPKDYIKFAYIVLGLSILCFLILKSFIGSYNAFAIATSIPLSIMFFVYFIFLPSKFIYFWLCEGILFFFLKNIKKGIDSETLIFCPRNKLFSPSYWMSPNYDLDLIFLIMYLKKNKINFSLCQDKSLEKFDEIMENKKIKNLYLFGHGKMHGFSLEKGKVINYCRYADKKYKKDFIFPVHCYFGEGKCITEYCVPIKNLEKCSNESGVISSLDIANYYLNKTLGPSKNLGQKIKKFGILTLYKLPIFFSLIIWIMILYFTIF